MGPQGSARAKGVAGVGCMWVSLQCFQAGAGPAAGAHPQQHLQDLNQRPLHSGRGAWVCRGVQAGSPSLQSSQGQRFRIRLCCNLSSGLPGETRDGAPDGGRVHSRLSQFLSDSAALRFLSVRLAPHVCLCHPRPVTVFFSSVAGDNSNRG